MTGNRLNRRTSDSRPSGAEVAAQSWHQKWHGGPGYGRCWCCCNACKRINPHGASAREAAVADIVARLRDSEKSAPAPPPSRRRGG